MSEAKILDELNTIRERIGQAKKHRRALSEEDTKVSLITPLLRALGWQVEDFHEVRFEYRHKKQDLPVDYALFLHRNPVLFIEAKALGSNLSDHKWAAQTIAYASAVGVTWCVLTDGDEYRIFNAHAPVDIDRKLFHTLAVSEVDPHEAAQTVSLLSRENMGENTLTTMWDAHFVDRQVKEVLEDLVTRQDASLINLVHKRTHGITKGNIRKSFERVEAYFDFPIMPTSADPKGTGRPTAPPKPNTKAIDGNPDLIGLIQRGVIKPPLDIEKTYLGQRLTATIQKNGTVSFNGATYSSLSVAAGMARNQVKGPPPPEHPHSYWPTNGWKFWRFKDPATGSLRPVDELRRQGDTA